MDPVLLTTRSAERFSMRVAQHLSLSYSVAETRKFDDGEIKSRALTNVQGRDVYLFQDLFADTRASIHDKLFELFILASAVKDAGASRVVLIAPYLCYARQDRRTEPGGAITSRYLANLIESSGVDQVIAMDVHNPSAFENAFRIPTTHLSACNVFVNELADVLNDLDGLKPLTVLAPDIGGTRRCEAFREALERKGRKNVELAYVIKRRRDTVLTEETVLGHLQGRTVILLDDMISTGGTVAHAVNACWKRGAGEIIVIASHGLFVGKAEQTLADLRLKQIMVTNSVASRAVEIGPIASLTKVVDVSVLFANEIRRLEALKAGKVQRQVPAEPVQ